MTDSQNLFDPYAEEVLRLAERCIGERAQYGVVSFISNYSFYAHRSHPLMRESFSIPLRVRPPP